MTTRSETPAATPPAAGTRARSTAPVVDRAQRGPTQAQIDAAGREVYASLARQDARSPRDAALHSLGRGATEQQITDWIARHRPEAVQRSTA